MRMIVPEPATDLKSRAHCALAAHRLARERLVRIGA